MHWYNLIKPEFKQLFLDDLREDYERIASDEEFRQYIVKDLNDEQKLVFDGVLKYKNRRDFDVLYKKYRLLSEQRKLLEKYEEAKKFNEELLSSSSWKATSGLSSARQKLR